jgi:Rps23 Pro-64 3,4-dihydroxylase Tpa1-like proline 4-hydroxylase
MFTNRLQISNLISNKLVENTAHYQEIWTNSGNIKHLIIDDLLPEPLAYQIYQCFPSHEDMILREGPQERKFISVSFPETASLVEECLYAFQNEHVIRLIANICNIPDLHGDPELYAGGISSMDTGCFLNPHIDNSHDRLRQSYRRLNLLYYASANWDSSTEGCLQIWPGGLKESPVIIPSIFNRLVIMATDRKSIHSVSKIVSPGEHRRLCVSNYFFSSISPENLEYYHSTSFRGFPDEQSKDLLLRLGGSVRTALKSVTGTFFGDVISNGHFRKKK